MSYKIKAIWGNGHSKNKIRLEKEDNTLSRIPTGQREIVRKGMGRYFGHRAEKKN